MRSPACGCVLMAGLLLFPLLDSSGQDAIPSIRRAHFAVTSGKFAEGLKLYQIAYRVAQDASPRSLQLNILNNIAACELASLFRYKEMRRTFCSHVRGLPEASRNKAFVASVDGNLRRDLQPDQRFSGRAPRCTPGSPSRAYSESGENALRARAMLTLAAIPEPFRLDPGERASVS